MKLKLLALFTLLLIINLACRKGDEINRPVAPLYSFNADIAVKWADMTLLMMRFSLGNSPTYASRSLGYMGLVMYESIVRGDSSLRSLNGQLSGLLVPQPQVGKAYNWLLSLNAGQKTLLKLLYPVHNNVQQDIHNKIDSLYNAIAKEQSNGLGREMIKRSEDFGIRLALDVFEWSKKDGGHEGYKRLFDPNFNFPWGLSFWVPPFGGQMVSSTPLHPYWGDNRVFVPANNNLPVPSILPYSTDPASDYYKIYKAVYDKDKTLTQPEMEIAAWWGDDPTETFSPPGHSYQIASIAIKKSGSNISKAAEAYARTGLAVADAFINCWKTKFLYFNPRPSSYVVANIDPSWRQFWPEPPFPAFPSGHSIQSAAAATVLTDLFGDNFSFIDRTHEGHRRYDDARFRDLRYPARSFTSFWDAAEECAYSRFLGGIHTYQDNEAGIQQGKLIGQHVNALQWHN